jgi:hypothetical protein
VDIFKRRAIRYICGYNKRMLKQGHDAVKGEKEPEDTTSQHLMAQSYPIGAGRNATAK